MSAGDRPGYRRTGLAVHANEFFWAYALADAASWPPSAWCSGRRAGTPPPARAVVAGGRGVRRLGARRDVPGKPGPRPRQAHPAAWLYGVAVALALVIALAALAATRRRDPLALFGLGRLFTGPCWAWTMTGSRLQLETPFGLSMSRPAGSRHRQRGAGHYVSWRCSARAGWAWSRCAPPSRPAYPGPSLPGGRRGRGGRGRPSPCSFRLAGSAGRWAGRSPWAALGRRRWRWPESGSAGAALGPAAVSGPACLGFARSLLHRGHW